VGKGIDYFLSSNPKMNFLKEEGAWDPLRVVEKGIIM
jgi:hypothetical protein